MEELWNRSGIFFVYDTGAMNSSGLPFDCLRFPTCTVNEFGRLVYWNQGAAELFGRSATDVVGREWHGVVRTVPSPLCCPLCQTRNSLRHGELVDSIEVVLCINGCRQSAIVLPLPINSAAQTSINFIMLTQQVTALSESVRQPIPIQSRLRQLNNGELIDELTEREHEILGCVIKGLDAREMGARLGISHATARTYVQRVLNKLGVRNKAQAVGLALTYNLIDTDGRPDSSVAAMPEVSAAQPSLSRVAG